MVDIYLGGVLGAEEPEGYEFSLPGYGGIENLNTQPAIPDITSTPQVVPAVIGSVLFPQAINQDVPNDGIIFEKAGIWQLNLTLSVAFLGVNNPRDIDLQLYNATEDNVLSTSLLSIGRNQEGVSFSETLLFQALPARVDDLWQTRLVSTADTFTSVILDSYSFSALFIDRLRS